MQDRQLVTVTNPVEAAQSEGLYIMSTPKAKKTTTQHGGTMTDAQLVTAFNAAIRREYEIIINRSPNAIRILNEFSQPLDARAAGEMIADTDTRVLSDIMDAMRRICTIRQLRNEYELPF